MLSLTEALGILGALTGSASMIWQWTGHRVRLNVSAEKFKNPFGEGLRVTVRNRGSRVTTLEKIDIDMPWLNDSQSRYDFAVCFRDSVLLPVRLNPGESWTGKGFIGIDHPADEPRPQAWLRDSELLNARCLLHFSHRSAPIVRQIVEERD